MTNTKAGLHVVPDFDTNIRLFASMANLDHTPGRVYDKVHEFTAVYIVLKPVGRYMVERKTGNIYGIKSWNQHNPRRVYGSLTTISQWDWSVFPAVPKSGTPAESIHLAHEAAYKAHYKKRGRPLGKKNKTKTLSTASSPNG